MIDHFEEGLVQFLNAAPSVTRVLTGGFHPGKAPKGVDRYGTYRNTIETVGHYVSGRSDGTPRLDYEIEVWVKADPDIARDAAVAIKTLLNGYRGWLGGAFCKRVKCEHAGSDEDPEDTEHDVWWYRRRLKITADVQELGIDRPPSYDDQAY